MWKPFFKAIAKYVPQALHILDPFHISAQLNKAVDETRRAEAERNRAMLPATGYSFCCR